MASPHLGVTKQDLRERYAERQKFGHAAGYGRPETYSDNPLIAFLVGILSDLGIVFPLVLLVPNPLRRSFARQDILKLDRAGRATAVSEITFRARNKGLLVIARMEIEAEERIFRDYGRVHFFRNDIEEDSDVSTARGAEGGIWKFPRMILEDEDELMIRFTNTFAFAQALVSYNIHGWEL